MTFGYYTLNFVQKYMTIIIVINGINIVSVYHRPLLKHNQKKLDFNTRQKEN